MRRWPAWSSACSLLAISFVAIAAMALQVRAGAEIVAVAFPPWWTQQQVLLAAASADAAIVRLTGLSSMVVVRPDGADGLLRLRDAGGWLILDPQAIAACSSNTPDL
jgi:hypothetical protein